MRAKTDAEIGAMVRAAFVACFDQPPFDRELDTVLEVQTQGVLGPRTVAATIRFETRKKP
jgi:hypothetical protein